MEDMNQGPWARLEEAVRDLVRTGKTVFVMTGPLYERDMPLLPNADEDHVIPSGYWKVIVCMTGTDEFEHAAYIMDQESGRNDPVTEKLTTVDKVEQRSGLDLLWELDDSHEETVESDINRTWADEWFN